MPVAAATAVPAAYPSPAPAAVAVAAVIDRLYDCIRFRLVELGKNVRGRSKFSRL
jgi:hypothetical protein